MTFIKMRSKSNAKLTISTENTAQFCMGAAREFLLAERLSNVSIVTQDHNQLIAQLRAKDGPVFGTQIFETYMGIALQKRKVADDGQTPWARWQRADFFDVQHDLVQHKDGDEEDQTSDVCQRTHHQFVEKHCQERICCRGHKICT